MKNLFLSLLLICSLSIAANAQSNVKDLLSPHGLTLDTVTNTGSETLTIGIAGSQSSVSILVTVTKISGTVAGSMKLWGSIDGGTTYAPIDGAGTFSPADVATQTYAWQVAPSGFTHYRLVYTGSGTMAASFKAKALWRK